MTDIFDELTAGGGDVFDALTDELAGAKPNPLATSGTAQDVMGFANPEEKQLAQTTKRVLKPVPALAAASMVQGAGGKTRELGDRMTQAEVLWAMLPRPLKRDPQAGMAPAGMAVAETGKQVAEAGAEVERAVQELEPLERGSWANSIRGGLTSTYQQLPGMLAGGPLVAAGKRAAGLAVSLAPLGQITGGRAYQEYRERGFDPSTASAGAAAEELIEVGTELLPMDTALSFVSGKAKAGLRELAGLALKFNASEYFGEALATLGQDVTNKYLSDPKLTANERQQKVDDYFTKVNPETGMTEARENFEETMRATTAQLAAMQAMGAPARLAVESNRKPEHQPETPEPVVMPPEAPPAPEVLGLPAPAVTVTPDGTAFMPRQLDDMVNARLNAGGMSPDQVAASRRKLAGMEAPAAPVVPAKPAGALEKAASLAAPVPEVPEVVAPVSGSPATVANHWDRLEQLAAQDAPVDAGGVTDGVSDVQEEVGGSAQEVPAVRVPDVVPRKVRVKAAEPGRITFDVDGGEVVFTAANLAEIPARLAEVGQERPVPVEERPVPVEPAENPLAVGDVFELDGVDYRIDSLDGGKVEAVDEDSGAVESWPTLEAFERQTGRRVVDRGTAVGESQAGLTVTDEAQAVPESPVVNDSLTTEPAATEAGYFNDKPAESGSLWGKNVGLNLIKNPAGTFSFIGSVPHELKYYDTETGGPISDDLLRKINGSTNPAMVMKAHGVKSRIFKSAQAAILAAEERGHYVANKDQYQNVATSKPQAVVKVPTVYGESVFVRQQDLDGDKTILPMFTKDGNRRDNVVHRDNIDLDGSKRQAKADEIKDMPTFAVISAKGDKAFASAIAAQREVNRLGLKDSHEVVRSEVLFPGTKGYIGRRKGFDGTVPKGGRPQDRGARKATAEGAARVEAAQKRLREVMANKDIVGKQRADMVASGRNLIQFLLTYADKDLETGFFKGDPIAYTQEDAPDGFRSFIYLDGNRAGEYGVERMPEARAEDAARTQREWKEQQEGFARVRAAENRPSWPEFDDVLGRMEEQSRKAGVLTDANEGDWRALAEGVARVEKSDVVSSSHAAEAISYLNAPAGKVSEEVAERKKAVFEAAGLPVPEDVVDEAQPATIVARGNGVEYGVVAVRHPSTGAAGYSLRVRMKGGEWAHSDNWAPTIEAIYERIAEKRTGTPSQIETADIVVDDLKARRQEVEEKKAADERAQQNEKSRVASVAAEVQRRRGVALEAIDAVRVKSRRGSINVYMSGNETAPVDGDIYDSVGLAIHRPVGLGTSGFVVTDVRSGLRAFDAASKADAVRFVRGFAWRGLSVPDSMTKPYDETSKRERAEREQFGREALALKQFLNDKTEAPPEFWGAVGEKGEAVDEQPAEAQPEELTPAAPAAAETPTHPVAKSLADVLQKIDTIIKRQEAEAIERAINKDIYAALKDKQGYSALAYRLSKRAEDGLRAALSLNAGEEKNKASMHRNQVDAFKESLREAIAVFEPGYGAASDGAADLATTDKDGYPVISPDDLPTAEIVSAYSHTSHRPRAAAEIEQRQYVEFMQELKDDMLKDLPAGSEGLLAAELGRVKGEYLARRKRVLAVRGNTVSAHVAGRSKFDSKQAEQRGSALDKAEDAFADWLRRVPGEVAEAVGVAEVRTEQDRQKTERKQAAREEADRLEKEQRKAEIALPIVNRRGAGVKEITREEWSKAGKDYKSIIVSADGTFRYRSMMTQGGLSPVFITDMKVVEAPGTEQAAAKEQDAGVYGVAAHTAFFKRLADGDGTAAETKANFQALIDNKEAIVAELSGMKKDDLLNMLGFMGQRNYRNDKKDAIVRAVYGDMLGDFVLGRAYSYSLGAGSQVAAIKKIVDGLTDADVAAHAKSVETNRQEAKEWVEGRAKAMKDPQSLDDFSVYLRGKMADGMSERQARLSLSPEQRTRFDALRAAESRKNRTERKTEQKATLQVAGQTVAGSIIETKHTKKGHDLFVVQLAERVERDDYNALNASAKKLGGYYSSFRGGGAVPGFQFTSRENAEAFVQLAGGDASAAQAAVSERMSAFEDDRSQGAAERLTAMADALEERADESLGRERKANTQRRAGMAARAEAAANADKALAQTMRNLAAAIERGDAEFLDRVREKKQVEYLTSALRLAKWNEVKDKYASPQERDRHENDPPTAETADYADYPTFTAFRSDLAALGRKLEGVEGLKQLGQRLLKVADDVTDAYVTFAKANLHKVSTFARKDGEAAMFASRQDAEAAIARSGYKGQAIVLPFKRGQNLIVLSPAEAQRRGVWEGDDDKRITLSADFGAELMEKLGRAAKRNRDLSVPWQFESVMDRRKLLSRMGIETAAEFRSALREFAGLQEQTKEPDRVKELERQMLGRKNDGLDFFPTPQSVADEMVAAADIQEGMAVLEPSAGWGHIAERIREAGHEPEVVELSNERKELLEAKGFNVVGRDFLEINPRDFTWGDIFRAKDGTEGRLAMTPGWELGSERVALKDEGGDALGYYDRSELEPVRKDGANSGYDRIIMNPPFSDRRDIQHVYHAYDLLKPGGRLVAIMSEGVFFGQDKKASAFRDWVEAVGGTDEKLEQGVFNDPSLPVNTGVAARMVVIDKQAGVEAPKFSVADRPSPRQQSVKFAEQVDRFLGGKMPGGQPLVVGHAPRVFLKLGVADRPMVMTQKNAAHVLEGKHGVDIETIKRLPELLDDPVAVLDSDTTDGAYVVVTTALHNGSPVVVAVHPDERIGRFDVHLVASVYGKDNGKWFGEQAGNLRYLDESKNLAMHMTAGVQFPMVRGARQGSGKTVLSPRDLVKYSGSGLSVAPASYLTGESGLGDVSVAPARVLPFLRNVLDAEGLEAVSVTGGNVDGLREVGRLFGKRIVFFRERDGGRAESGRGGRGEAPRSGRAVRHDAASGDLRRGTINGFMLPSRPDVIYLNVHAPDPLLRVLGHELGHSLRVEDAALWGELVKGLQPLVRNWSDFKAAKGDARYANLSDDALAEELFGDVIGENFLNELFWRDMAQANESLFKRVAKKAVALLSKALRALTGRTGVERYVSDMTQARAVVAKVLSRYGERAALGQYERFAKQEDSNYLSGRIDGKALLQRMMEMGHSLEDIARLVEGTRYAAESATVESADTADVRFSVAQAAQDRAKAQAAFLKKLDAETMKIIFGNPSEWIPERVKYGFASVFSNPHFEAKASKHREKIYELNIERSANANEMKHDIMAEKGDYAGMEGVVKHWEAAGKSGQALIRKLVMEGTIRREVYSEADLDSRRNPTGAPVPEAVKQAYLAVRQVVEKSNEVRIDRMGRLRLIPFEGTEYYQELVDLLDENLTVDEVRRRFGIHEKAVEAYQRIRADRKRLDEAVKPYRSQAWYDSLREVLEKGLTSIEVQNEFGGPGGSKEFMEAFREAKQKVGAEGIATAETFRKARWYSILSDLLTRGDEHPMLQKLDLYNAYIGAKEFDSQLAQMKEDWGNLPGYFPLMRKDGEWHVRIQRVEDDGTFETVFMKTAKNKTGARLLEKSVREDFQKYLPRTFDPNAKYIVSVAKNTALPEEIFAGLGPQRAMEALITKAIGNVSASGLIENPLELQREILKEMANQISARGFGRHRLHRSENLIEGFDEENIPALLAQFVGGEAGWLSKAEYAMLANKAISEIPESAPDDIRWAEEYSRDALKNATYLDQLFGTARSIITLMFLGFKTSTVVLNGTQNYIYGQAVLSKITKGATRKLLKAQAEVVQDALRRRAGKESLLSADDQWALEEGIRRGSTEANLVRNFSGMDDTGGPMGKFQSTARWLTEKSMIPFQMVETHWNREPMLLAAYRVYREQGMEQMDALKAAERMVRDTHYHMGKENIPGLLRKMGPFGRSLYTFQGFSHNYILGMFTHLKDGEVAVVLRSLTALVLFGGLAAVPFGDDLDKWYRRIFGERPLRMLEKWLKETAGEYTDFGDQIADFVIHGAPALAGVNFSRALGVNVSFLSADDESLAERFLGVWGGLGNKVKFGAMAAAKGDAYRAVEFLSPEALANLMRSYRHWEDGATTLSGRPVFGDDGKQLRYTATEGVIRAFGFMPLRPSKQTEKRWDARLAREFWNDRKSDILAQWRRAPGSKKVRELRIAFNNDLRKSQARWIVKPISDAVLRRALKDKPNVGEMMF